MTSWVQIKALHSVTQDLVATLERPRTPARPATPDNTAALTNSRSAFYATTADWERAQILVITPHHPAPA